MLHRRGLQPALSDHSKRRVIYKPQWVLPRGAQPHPQHGGRSVGLQHPSMANARRLLAAATRRCRGDQHVAAPSGTASAMPKRAGTAARTSSPASSRAAPAHCRRHRRRSTPLRPASVVAVATPTRKRRRRAAPGRRRRRAVGLRRSSRIASLGSAAVRREIRA